MSGRETQMWEKRN